MRSGIEYEDGVTASPFNVKKKSVALLDVGISGISSGIVQLIAKLVWVIEFPVTAAGLEGGARRVLIFKGPEEVEPLTLIAVTIKV